MPKYSLFFNNGKRYKCVIYRFTTNSAKITSMEIGVGY